MIIEMYFLIECLVLTLLFLGWIKEHPIYWALACIFSAINIFTSYSIEYVIHVISSGGLVTTTITSLSFPILSYINIMFFVLGLLFFFLDIFNPKETVVVNR